MGGSVSEGRIQDLVDERQQCRRDRNFDEADKIRDELRDMGVRVNDTDLTWDGPHGMRGKIDNGKGGGGGKGRREGDWDCADCGKLNFASRVECFSCGAPKPRGGSRDYYDDRGGRRGGDDRRGGRDDYDRGGGRRYDDDRRGGRDDYDDRRGGRDDRRRGRSPSYDDYDDRRGRRGGRH